MGSLITVLYASAASKDEHIALSVTQMQKEFRRLEREFLQKHGDNNKLSLVEHASAAGIIGRILQTDFAKPNGEEMFIRVYVSGKEKNWFLKQGARMTFHDFSHFHVGIVVFGVSISWLDDSLIRIGPWNDSRTCFLMYSPENPVVRFTHDIAVKMAYVIAKWNSTVRYDPMVNNCQKFVKDFFKTVFDTSPFPKGLVGHKIKELARGITVKSIRTHTGRVLKFSNHDELDEIEIAARKDNSLTAEEFEVLKIYHRGFQMSEHYSNRAGGERSCPLGRLPTGVETVPIRSISCKIDENYEDPNSSAEN